MVNLFTILRVEDSQLDLFTVELCILTQAAESVDQSLPDGGVTAGAGKLREFEGATNTLAVNEQQTSLFTRPLTTHNDLRVVLEEVDL